MSKSNFIQVFEYQKIRYGADKKFKKHHFEAMVRFNEKNDNKYYTIIYNGIKFNSYVGVIRIEELTIEILPKADNNDNPDKSVWQGVLLGMLRVCRHINVDNVSETTLKKRYNSILNVYFEMYLNEIEGLIRRGLIKKYRRVQSNQLALKGKLVFARNIQKNTVHKERFYCEHQVYDRNHLLHQILLKGLKILDSLANNSLSDKLGRVLFEFDTVKEVNITAKHFEKALLNRKTLPYQKALEIAKMLILNYSPGLKSGKDNMLTLLFDMNKLWEEYIYRILQKHKPDKYAVSFQNRKVFWERKTIRPDIVITDNEGRQFIIDTKWKIVEAHKPSDDDLKQMFAYNLYWKAQKSMLLYPRINQRDSDFGNYKYRPIRIEKDAKTEKLPNQCKLGFVDVVDDKQMINAKTIAKGIFEKFSW